MYIYYINPKGKLESFEIPKEKIDPILNDNFEGVSGLLSKIEFSQISFSQGDGTSPVIQRQVKEKLESLHPDVKKFTETMVDDAIEAKRLEDRVQKISEDIKVLQELEKSIKHFFENFRGESLVSLPDIQEELTKEIPGLFSNNLVDNYLQKVQKLIEKQQGRSVEETKLNHSEWSNFILPLYLNFESTQLKEEQQDLEHRIKESRESIESVMHDKLDERDQKIDQNIEDLITALTELNERYDMKNYTKPSPYNAGLISFVFNNIGWDDFEKVTRDKYRAVNECIEKLTLLKTSHKYPPEFDLDEEVEPLLSNLAEKLKANRSRRIAEATRKNDNIEFGDTGIENLDTIVKNNQGGKYGEMFTKFFSKIYENIKSKLSGLKLK